MAVSTHWNCHVSSKSNFFTHTLSFIFEASLDYHIQYVCETAKLRRKLKWQEKKASRNFVCTDCNKIYATNKDLQNHINSVHLKLRPFKCEQCPSAFTQKVSLNSHVKTKHENNFEGITQYGVLKMNLIAF